MEPGVTSGTIHQTLHGYDQGHRLLASSLSLDPDEKRLLDRLSDLSGYLPSGLRFDAYHTGFPCGRFYALACTWPDSSGTRAGTVLTHTLLVPLERAAELSDLWVLAPLWREPASAQDTSSYRKPLSEAFRSSDPSPPMDLSSQHKRALMALWVAQAERPIIWLEPDPHIGAQLVRALWRVSWPEWRASLAFCTMALQTRTLGTRPFDLLVAPPVARGAFHEHARRSGWWLGDRVDSQTETTMKQPWLEPALSGDPTLFAHARQRCLELDLPLPEVQALPRLLRFVELEPEAPRRLTAARAVADLLALVWPNLEPSHPVWKRAIHVLLDLQAQAPEAPKPLWELNDLLNRPQLATALLVSPELQQTLSSVVTWLLSERLRSDPTRVLQAMLGTEEALKRLDRIALVHEAERAAIAGSDHSRRKELGLALLEYASTTTDSERFLRTMQELSGPERLAAASSLLSNAPHERCKRDNKMLLECARRLEDPALLLLAHRIFARGPGL